MKHCSFEISHEVIIASNKFSNIKLQDTIKKPKIKLIFWNLLDLFPEGHKFLTLDYLCLLTDILKFLWVQKFKGISSEARQRAGAVFNQRWATHSAAAPTSSRWYTTLQAHGLQEAVLRIVIKKLRGAGELGVDPGGVGGYDQNVLCEILEELINRF